MFLSDVSVKRPVLATVVSLLLVAFGLISFDRLPLREYPDIDPPVVSVETVYPGAAASVVETRITSSSRSGSPASRASSIHRVLRRRAHRRHGEFKTGRDIDAAANDIRDRVSGCSINLPQEADPPEVRKVDSNEDVIMSGST